MAVVKVKPPIEISKNEGISEVAHGWPGSATWLYFYLSLGADVTKEGHRSSIYTLADFSAYL